MYRTNRFRFLFRKSVFDRFHPPLIYSSKYQIVVINTVDITLLELAKEIIAFTELLIIHKCARYSTEN
jgi:hypothetical protein